MTSHATLLFAIALHKKTASAYARDYTIYGIAGVDGEDGKSSVVKRPAN